MVAEISGNKKKKSEKIYPKFEVRHEYMPDAKDLEVGDYYELKMKVKVVGLSISKYRNDTEFEIHEYDIEPAEKNSKNNSKKEY